MKNVRIILSPEAEEVYNHLVAEAPNSKTERMILDALKKKAELLKLNPHLGDPIAKPRIPREFVTKYGANNLFRVELPARWRMLYTLTNDEKEIDIIAFVLDITDHPAYDKIFGYKKK